jgi:hypothetical protein
MCLSKEQTLEKYMMNPLITIMLEPDEKPNCFRIKAGQVNRFKFDYVKGIMLTDSEWFKSQEKEKEEVENTSEEF